MQTTQTRRPVRPTTPADLWRLADQARTNGVRLLSEGLSGERFATSATDPGTVYRLTAYSCTCRGFTHHQRCQHHSLLLAELGWLPDLDPAPVATVSCPTCGGRGIDPACTGHPVAGMTIHCPCYACQGAGTVAVSVVLAA
ncbi:MAG: hypothetical protein M3Q03_00820 [Chloroflexota bacterium]|nr:hypothetical protein [Chloroflexota bacterium]